MKDFPADNGRVTVLHIILRLFSAISSFAEWQGFRGVVLLEQRIAHIPFVVQDIVDGIEMPCFVAVSPWNAIRIELVGDGLLPAALQIEVEDPANDPRLRLVDIKLTVYELIPIGGLAAVEISGFHSLLIAPAHILGDGFRLLLRCHAGEGEYHFKVDSCSVDPLLLEVDADSKLFQPTHHGQ